MSPSSPHIEDVGATDTATLFARWSGEGDVVARAGLIERFLPLARKLSLRYSVANEPADDLFQVASLGLVKAVERFDPSRGVAFTTYAVPTIVGELKRHFRDTTWALHVERSAQERARAVMHAEKALSAQIGRSPTVAELAHELRSSTEYVLEGIQALDARTTVSFDAPVAGGDEDGHLTLGDTLGAPDARHQLTDDRLSIAAEARESLAELDRRILHLRFSHDLPQREIAERVGVSQMHVSRLLRRSIGRLRERLSEPDGAPDHGPRASRR